MKKRRKHGIDDFIDEVLIEGYLDGDSDYFDVLYNRYKNKLYGYLNNLLSGNHSLVDDIFQQTWIKVIHQLPKYRNRQKFFAWLARIAHNLSMDYFRKNSRREEVFTLEEGQFIKTTSSKEPWRELDRVELSKALSWAIKQLKDDQKEVFLLRQEEIAFKEIAVIQDCSINTVLGRMQYAIKNLQKLLADWNK